MKIICFFTILVALLLWSYLPIQAHKDTFPVPATSPNQLFYLQRSKDANTVIYEANVTASKTLDPGKPVQVYWIRYAEQGQRKDLSSVQWRMAYGYVHNPSSDSNSYDISLNAFKKRQLHVTFHQGKPVATTSINGQQAYLQKIFVQVDPKPHLIPKVQFVDMYGSDLSTGLPVYERILPD
ncbi:DUF4833 domain-containing protein [Spirosoma sp. BT702]|uniref:DUF4833 domain-containing protein n=1 Tax=Spirosoma profusum TaxID=2771354 RepID=A0A926Y2X2_9BACT|nr:DUF4833 domain-containing protein [Spirosoma profusum]MBD2701315.1 DUF4833 domain-containing protein [Spirosoma profusum]